MLCAIRVRTVCAVCVVWGICVYGVCARYVLCIVSVCMRCVWCVAVMAALRSGGGRDTRSGTVPGAGLEDVPFLHLLFPHRHWVSIHGEVVPQTVKTFLQLCLVKISSLRRPAR